MHIQSTRNFHKYKSSPLLIKLFLFSAHKQAYINMLDHYFSALIGNHRVLSHWCRPEFVWSQSLLYFVFWMWVLSTETVPASASASTSTVLALSFDESKKKKKMLLDVLCFQALLSLEAFMVVQLSSCQLAAWEDALELKWYIQSDLKTSLYIYSQWRAY